MTLHDIFESKEFIVEDLYLSNYRPVSASGFKDILINEFKKLKSSKPNHINTIDIDYAIRIINSIPTHERIGELEVESIGEE